MRDQTDTSGRQAVLCCLVPDIPAEAVQSGARARGVHMRTSVSGTGRTCASSSPASAPGSGTFKLHLTGRHPTTHPFLWKLWKLLERCKLFRGSVRGPCTWDGHSFHSRGSLPGPAPQPTEEQLTSHLFPTTETTHRLLASQRQVGNLCGFNRCHSVVHKCVRNEVNSFTKH